MKRKEGEGEKGGRVHESKKDKNKLIGNEKNELGNKRKH